jgi:hypothetical protein
MKRLTRPSFDDFFGLWKKSRVARLKSGIQQWQKKIKADPFLLNPEQLAALRAADFPLFARDVFWIDRYLELFTFTKEHGHALFPVGKNRGSLATWISTQRTHRMEGKLTPSRQRALHRLKFVWEPHETVWKDRVTVLTRFIRTHGHMRIPRDETYRQLAGWVVSCRMRKEKLSPKRRRELEQVGFVWNPFEAAWQNGLEELKKFAKDHSHGNVPIRSPAYPLAAGVVFLGRRLYRAGKLDADRRSELESLGVILNLMDRRWEERYRQLTEFHRSHGHVQMPENRPEYKKLKRWLRRQKRRVHSLSNEQKKRLRALDASFFVKRPPGWHGVYHETRSRVSGTHLQTPRCPCNSLMKGAFDLHQQDDNSEIGID